MQSVRFIPIGSIILVYDFFVTKCYKPKLGIYLGFQIIDEQFEIDIYSPNTKVINHWKLKTEYLCNYNDFIFSRPINSLL